MQNRIVAVQVSDTRDGDSSNAAYKQIKNNLRKLLQPTILKLKILLYDGLASVILTEILPKTLY